MTLRRKLLLVALCTLALPVAGWLYVRQMQTLLREGQAQALTASAQVVARSLVVVGAALPPPAADGWYVQHTDAPISVDGYGDDWAALTPWSRPLGAGARLLLAEDDRWLYLLVEVRDTTRTRADATDADALRADHLILTLGRGAQQRSYLLASAAPGPFAARPLGDAVDGLPDQLNGGWQEDGSGWRVELRLPRALQLDRLGIGVYDAAHPATATPSTPHPLLAFSPALSMELAQLAPAGVRARVLAPGAWVLAQSGRLHEEAQASGWLAALVYRALVAAPLDAAAPWMDDAPRLDTPSVCTALAGASTATWRDGQTRGSAVLSVTVPIVEHGKQRGALMLEQASRAVPLLANRALFGLLLASFGVLLVAGLVLFAFATRLSLRLGRLRDAAERAHANDGHYDGPFPLTADEDELGDLARSFARLFDAVGGYTDYLRTLASKLSHELNTPLAIVKSSLDNLEHAALPADTQPYLQRARDGVARMGALVRAMGEATRMERAIAAAEPEDFDLAEVARGCAESYRALAATQRIETDLPDSVVPLHGAPELVAQALDKLFDNARSFAPADGWIRLGLRRTDDGAELTVANQGPLLPASMQGRLFDSLVSLREATAGGEAPHLGLGLYVVRLIAERHGGSASARNLGDASGVVFTLHLRGMPRPRLG